MMELGVGVKRGDLIKTERHIIRSGKMDERRQRVGEQERAEHQRVAVHETAGLHCRTKQNCGGNHKEDCGEHPGVRCVNPLAPHEQDDSDEDDNRCKQPAPWNGPRVLSFFQHGLSATSSLFSARSFSLKSSTSADAMARTMLGRIPHSDCRRTSCCVVR